MPTTNTKRTLLKAGAAFPLAVPLAALAASHAAPKNAFASIRRAPVKPGSAAELATKVPETVLPTLRSLPGFLSFQMIYAENDMVTAITVYESAEAAKQANDKIVPLVRQVFGPLLAGPLEPSVGAVIASASR